MLRRTVCSILLAFGAAAEAQISRRGPTYPADPGYWVGLSIGYVEGLTTSDEATGATWEFGYTSQLRATLEKTVARGVTIGVVAGYATAPLTYQFSRGPGDACVSGCLGKADIAQYLGFVRGGAGGLSHFHATFNAEAGVTQFSNFRDRSTQQSFEPTNGSYDFTFGFGGGFAYAMSRGSEIFLEHDYDFVFHKQRSNTTTQAVPRLLTFRGGFRFGF
jgi:hypothetical protein